MQEKFQTLPVNVLMLHNGFCTETTEQFDF